MKRILFAVLTACLLLTAGVVELVSARNQITVTLYCQEDAVSDRVLQSFTRETGIEIQLCLPSDASIDPAECDLLLADSETLRGLSEDGRLSTLDASLTESLDQIDPAFQTLTFDPQNHMTIPALWTTMGLLYDPSQADTRITGWSDLFDDQLSGALLMPSDSQTAFAAALCALGQDVNSVSADALSAAASYLAQQQPRVAAYCTPAQIEGYFQSGQAALTPCYASTAITVMSHLSALSFVIPSEGSWTLLLSYAIPADAQQPEAAAQLLEFLCRAENQAANGAYSGYSVVSAQAYSLLDAAWQSNPLAYPGQSQTPRFPILQGQSSSLRTQRQIDWLSIQTRTEQ